MNKHAFEQYATLPSIVGRHFPPDVLTISADFQFCVDAGVRSAAYFFKEPNIRSLQDLMAASVRAFINKLKQLLAEQGDSRPFNQQYFIDAFVAGYLGRIQQELEIREESTCLCQ